MKIRDVMHADVVAIRPDDTVLEAAKLMLERKISGLVVMDGGNLIGIVTEGDLLRRAETQTGRERPRWLEFLTGSGTLAGEYVKMNGRKVHEVMTKEVHAVPDTGDLREAVELMEKHHIKRVPVVYGRAVVGMITRADIMRAFVKAASKPATPMSDDEIRRHLLAHLKNQKWIFPDTLDIKVTNGAVTVHGVVLDERQMTAIEVAAENIPGVTKINDKLIWVDPVSGFVMDANHQVVV